MKLGKIIKDYINEHNISVREFSRQSNLSNTYIANIVNNEDSNPSVDALDKIAAVMGCSTIQLFEMLDDDQMIRINASSSDALSEEEKEIISKYRRLDDKGKHTVNTVLRMEYERIINRET